MSELNPAALQSANVVLRRKLTLLLGAARQYRAAERLFNATATDARADEAAIQAATAHLLEARATFDQMIGGGG